MDRSGNASVSTLAVLCTVALVGVPGLGLLGSAFDDAIGEAGRGHPTVAVSTNAGIAAAADEAVDFMRLRMRPARSEPLVQIYPPASERNRVTRHGNVVNVGSPDLVHERAQAVRYGQVRGGGLYRFPRVESQEGVDGFFHRWQGTPNLADVGNLKTQAKPYGVPVSLKDFSARGKPFWGVLDTIRRNARKVRHAGYDGSAHLFATVPQIAAHEILDVVRAKPDADDVLMGSGAPTAAFRRIVFDAADGVVSLFMKRGDLHVEGPDGRVGKVFGPDALQLPAPRGRATARQAPPTRLVIGGGEIIKTPGASPADMTLHYAEGVGPDVAARGVAVPARDGAFDTVRFERVPAFVVEERDFAALAEAHRVLKPGGQLQLQTQLGTNWKSIDARLRTLGFENLTPYHDEHGGRIGTYATRGAN